MKKTFILLLMATVFIYGCDKDAKVTDKIDGIWNIDEKTNEDTGEILENVGSFSFHDCVQDSCSGVLTLDSNALEVEFDWFITAKGTTMTVKSSDANGFIVKGIYTIEYIDKEKLEFSYEQLGIPFSFKLTRTGDAI